MAPTHAVPARQGKRAAQAATRNAAIEKAAMALATAGDWPSPSEVAKRAGISESVVERETDRLLPARRKWVELKGHDHPQWIDPDKAANAGGDAVAAAEGETAASRRTKPVDEEREARRKELRRQMGRKLRRLSGRVGELEELNRRINLGVRPAEVQRILDAGAKKAAAGEAEKGVGVGAGEDAG